MLTKEQCKKALNDYELIKEFMEDLPSGLDGIELSCDSDELYDILNSLIEEHFEILDKLKTGDLSDGYHTYNELYHHRAVLFSVIVNQNKDIAWKSKKHHDGTMYDGMFIVGIDTPQGQYSYHYDIEPYWNMFDCKELDNAPVWDGHEPKDIDRLRSIDNNPPLGFEELKKGMWIWDNTRKEWMKVETTRETYTKFIECWAIGWDLLKNFEYHEERFYRKEVQND
ncbi:WDGH domain-containing protein [Faecalicoccus sp. LCP19S3_E3]|uniref:WDGH domain-containing protein n=1 Tax=unclassified Faecalicoccus TaxID=2643311 RepID=UPI003F8F9BD1